VVVEALEEGPVEASYRVPSSWSRSSMLGEIQAGLGVCGLFGRGVLGVVGKVLHWRWEATPKGYGSACGGRMAVLGIVVASSEGPWNSSEGECPP